MFLVAGIPCRQDITGKQRRNHRLYCGAAGCDIISYGYKSLTHISFETLAEAFGAAFTEYEVQVSPDELRTMLRRRGFDPALSFAAFDGDRLVGYVIFEPAAGDTTQIAVSKTHRRQGIGSALLGEMLRRNCASGIKCINTEVGRDEALVGFLQARNIALTGKQFEMIKRL